jgi:hypothetical protein
LGCPALATHLIVGLHYLKHPYNVSEEVVVSWAENPYWQCFCGAEYFTYEFPCDPTSLVKLALRAWAQAPHGNPSGGAREQELLRDLVAIDGSLLPALQRMGWAVGQDEQHRAAFDWTRRGARLFSPFISDNTRNTQYATRHTYDVVRIHDPA